MASRAGVNVSTVSRWEAGKTVPNAPELTAVLNALEVGRTTRRTLLETINAPRALRQLRQAEASAIPPLFGDLLWAMRKRRGWTQAQTARLVGVTQAQIVRWEQGDAWPSDEKMHALCWALKALPEEVAALTCSGSNTRVWDKALPPQASPDEGQWQAHLTALLDYPPPDTLLDLTLLATEERLSKLAVHHTFAARFLPTAYAVHARHHHNARRLAQAAHWAERGLALMRQGSFTTGERTIWFGNVVVVAAHASQSKRASGVRWAASVVREFLPLARPCYAHYAWGLTELAGLLTQMGNGHEAIALGKRSYQIVSAVSEHESYNRLLDLAQLLVEVNRFQEALAVLGHSSALEAVTKAEGLHRRLLEAQSLLGLGDQSGAEELLRFVEQAIRGQHAPRLQDKLNQLTACL
jgi:transcriptional regulator with XRE-family HTH domain